MKAILLLNIGLIFVLFTFFFETHTQDVRSKSKIKAKHTKKIDRKQRSASKFHRIEQRLNVLEVHQNAEIQYRKEDTELIFKKISGIEHILNTSLLTSRQCENKVPDQPTNGLTNNDNIGSIDENKRLMTAFEDEKRVNAKIRGKVRKMENNIKKCFIDKMEIKEYFTNISRENNIINKELEVLPFIVSGNMTHLTNKLQQMEDLVAKQQMNDLVTQQQMNDLVTQQQIKDLEAKQEKKDLATQEQMKDLVAKQEKRDLATQEQIKDLMTKQQEVLNTVLLKLSLVSQELNESKIGKKKDEEQNSDTDYAASCKDLYQQGHYKSGINKIKPSMSEQPFQVYCDQTNHGGGWTLFQRRLDGSVDFNKTWEEYKNGFGDMKGEFWLGNKYLNLLTGTGTHELHIVLEDWQNQRKYASYSEFNVLSEDEQYKLNVSGYSGDARDSLSYHGGQMFSTHDRDNDKSSGNCAREYSGGWWFNDCSWSNLNGKYIKGGSHNDPSQGIYWFRWRGDGYSYTWRRDRYSYKFTEMKFR